MSETCGTCKKLLPECTCDAEGKGSKGDLGKLRYDLLPDKEVEEIVEIITFGAEKYGPNNWKQVPKARDRYYAALRRHLTAWREAEKLDSDSGKTHLAHAACNILFLMWIDKNKPEDTDESK